MCHDPYTPQRAAQPSAEVAREPLRWLGGELEGDNARIRVRFLSEFRSRPMTESAVTAETDERRAAEMWTFERRATAKDGPWILRRVEPAEA